MPITSNCWPSTAIILPTGSSDGKQSFFDVGSYNRHWSVMAIFKIAKKAPRVHIDLARVDIGFLDPEQLVWYTAFPLLVTIGPRR